jgi:hypothetical protein
MSVLIVNFTEMEPMTLGSPVRSSASPVSPGFTSPYLPEFLMGESTPGVSWNVGNLKHIQFCMLDSMWFT